MKRAFTIIELIFVIVIIGILSTIAIPMLNVTRDDSKISAIIYNTKNIIGNSKNYFNAKGEAIWQNATLFEVTSTYLYTDNSCSSLSNNNTKVLTDGERGTFYICNNNDAIIKLDFNKTHLTISSTNINTSISSGIKNSTAFKSIEKSHRLGGISIKK